MTLEKRSLMAAPEARSAEDGRTIAGYAAVFNSEAVIGGAFREMIMPGAFADAIQGDIRSYFNHDSSKVLGRTKSGTLRLHEDSRGLAYSVDLPDNTVGRDLMVSMERGDIDGSSFAFQVPEGGDEWDWSGDLPLRTIRTATLYELGPVTTPAYEDATVALRSLESERGEHEKRAAEAKKSRDLWTQRKAEAEQKFRRI